MSVETQPGFAIWLTGLPASGKTTLAYALRPKLLVQGKAVQILDSDELRQQLTPKPTYAPEERAWFYDMIIFLAELLTNNGVNVIIAATATRRAYRDEARRRLTRFAEVYVNCPPEACRARDPKGLWQRADKGQIARLPGVGTIYEVPETPEVQVDTAQCSVEEAAYHVWEQLQRQEFFNIMMI